MAGLPQRRTWRDAWHYPRRTAVRFAAGQCPPDRRRRVAPGL